MQIGNGFSLQEQSGSFGARVTFQTGKLSVSFPDSTRQSAKTARTAL
jgi:hypothetical protein